MSNSVAPEGFENANQETTRTAVLNQTVSLLNGGVSFEM